MPSRQSRSRSPQRDRHRRQPDFPRTRDNGYASRNTDRNEAEDRGDDRRKHDKRPRDGRYTEDDRRGERDRDRRRYDEADERDGSVSCEACSSRGLVIQPFLPTLQNPPERAKSPPKPNFANSGLLAAESNTVRVTSEQASNAGTPDVTGVVLKYHEPPEARKPTKNWRLYVFKGKEQVGE